MIRVSGTVTYTDETSVDFAAGINVLAQWETYAQTRKIETDAQKSPMTWTLYVAYAALDLGKDIGFDTWRKRVADVDLKADDADPTQADQSAE